MLKPSRSPSFVLMPLALLMLLAACASGSPTYLPAAAKPPAIPPLSQSARQPKTPPECLPSCSAGVEREFSSWLSSPTAVAPPGQAASAATTR